MSVYKLWHGVLVHLPRHTRFTIGVKVDHCFTQIIALILRAGYTPRSEKQTIITEASIELDNLKFFLQLLWEMNALDRQTYTAIAVPLVEIGKNLGGWLKYIPEKNATPYAARSDGGSAFP